MTYDTKIGKQEQDQRTYENTAEARRVTMTDSIGNSIGVDSSTNTLQSINYEHHEIHSGSHFYLCNYKTLGSGDIEDFTYTTSNTVEWLHLTFAFQGTGAISFEIFEGAVVDAAGIVLIPRNNNRNSANVTSGIARVGDTFTSEGTSIYAQFSGANKVAGFAEREREIILKQNTVYIFKLTNQTNLNNTVSWCAEWYEHTDKN